MKFEEPFFYGPEWQVRYPSAYPAYNPDFGTGVIMTQGMYEEREKMMHRAKKVTCTEVGIKQISGAVQAVKDAGNK